MAGGHKGADRTMKLLQVNTIGELTSARVTQMSRFNRVEKPGQTVLSLRVLTSPGVGHATSMVQVRPSPLAVAVTSMWSMSSFGMPVTREARLPPPP